MTEIARQKEEAMAYGNNNNTGGGLVALHVGAAWNIGYDSVRHTAGIGPL
jgi:hypothetical protein